MQYLIHYAPALAAKDSSSTKDQSNNEDPFAHPVPELTVLDDLNGTGSYQLLLNKFPVVPEHVLLVTKQFESQSDALSPEDLVATYQLLCKMDDEDENKRHMAFYNSGPASGSSQDHKHLQLFQLPSNFIPLQDKICSGKEHFLPGFNAEPLQDAKVSFAHFVLPLPESSDEVDEDLLAMCYISLLQRALTFFQDWTNERPDLKKSYNVLLTKNWICVVPRSKSVAEIEDEDTETMHLGINATGYAGMILAKDEAIYNKIVGEPRVIDQALLNCGFPNTSGQKPTEYHY